MLIDGRMPNAVLADVLGRLAIALAAGVDLRRAWLLHQQGVASGLGPHSRIA